VELPGQEESLSVVEAAPKAVEPLDEQEEDLLAVDEPAKPEESLVALEALPRVVVVPWTSNHRRYLGRHQFLRLGSRRARQ
jgi:hypothetical protein